MCLRFIRRLRKSFRAATEDGRQPLIGEAVMMVSGDMTLEQIGQAIHPHPTQTELFGEMARRLLARLRRSAKVAAK